MEGHVEEAAAHPRDREQLRPDDEVGKPQGRMGIADQEGRTVESSADKGRDPCEKTADV
jgi:hypothetical protein